MIEQNYVKNTCIVILGPTILLSRQEFIHDVRGDKANEEQCKEIMDYAMFF